MSLDQAAWGGVCPRAGAVGLALARSSTWVSDRALHIAGRQLRTKLRVADLVVLLGGDEFVMLFDGLDDAQRLHRCALAVAHSVTRPLRMDVAVGALGVNIGAVIRPRGGQSEQSLLRAEDRFFGRDFSVFREEVQCTTPA